MRLSVSAALAGFLLVTAARANAQTPTRSDVSEITTTGRGEIHVTPDRAVVVVTIETHASSAGSASSANSQITNATIKAVKAASTPQDTVTTESYMVMTDYQKGKPNGFQVRNSVRIRLHDIASVGPVIDAALAAGATQVPQVQFTSSASMSARRQAIKLAVAEARADAEALAEAAGGSVGKLLSVTNLGDVGIGRARLESVVVTGANSGGYVPPPMIPNDIAVPATVNARWEFVPRRTP